MKIISFLILTTVFMIGFLSKATGITIIPNNISKLEKESVVKELSASLTSEKTVYTVAEDIRLNWKLTNKSNRDFLLISHYLAGPEKHYDNLELRIVNKEGREPISLMLSSRRAATAKVTCILKPGKTITHILNLTKWLQLKNVYLGSGNFEITAIYNVTAKESPVTEWMTCDEIDQKGNPYPSQQQSKIAKPVWHGILESNQIQINIIKGN